MSFQVPETIEFQYITWKLTVLLCKETSYALEFISVLNKVGENSILRAVA